MSTLSKTNGFQSQSIFRDTVRNNLNTKVSFQQEDKFRASLLREAKVETKRRNQQNLKSQIEMMDEKKESLNANKLMVKAARQDTYNRLCYLANV